MCSIARPEACNDKLVIDVDASLRDARTTAATLTIVNSSLFRRDLDDASVPWISTSHLGVCWYPLGAEASGSRKAKDEVVLIRMSPGRGYPPHRHLGDEDVLILQGGYADELGEHPAGTFLRYLAGSTHSPVARGDPGLPESDENPACILFAIARGGVQELAQ